MMKWSEQRILGLSDEEAGVIMLQAARLEESYRPDGAVTYIPATDAGALFQEVKSGLVVKTDGVVGLVYRALRNHALGIQTPPAPEMEPEEPAD